MPEISVNLATYNRAAFLEPCLVSLCEQTIDPSRYEICVVNNACTDNTPEIVDKIVARYPRHKIFMVREPVPGLSRARNCGLRATQAHLVAHVDDDGTVNPDWLELFLARFAELGADTAVIGGEIDPVWEIPKPEWLTEPMQWFMSALSGLGHMPRFLEGTECTSEGNSCYRRSALAAVGNFPEELGRAGSSLLSGEQVVQIGIRRNGGRAFYDPRLILHHFIHADRIRPFWLRRRLFWQGASKFAIREYQIRHDLPVENEAFINLPLKPQDWEFIKQDTPENLEESMMLFHSLGFALALTGIMPSENAATTAPTKGKAYYDVILKNIYDLPPERLSPPLFRRAFFWQGVSEYASCARSNETGSQNPSIADLPLDRGDWTFINDANEPPTEDKLNRLRSLGFVLASSGFIPTS